MDRPRRRTVANRLSEHFTITISTATHEKLFAEAVRRQMSMAALARDAIEQLLASVQPQEASDG